MKLNLSKSQEIQFIYPTEPEWSSVEDDVLIELVEDYISEPSCATSALSELSSRKNNSVIRLCEFILNEEQSDKWLKCSALGILLSSDFRIGFDRALSLVDNCNRDMLSEILEALNYELQGEDMNYVLQHTIVSKMVDRLSSEVEDVEYSDIFYKHIDKV